MKAYAILDGGGAKGAALVGCLKAAEDFGVEFQGYGGTSAGAIVATLSSVGYRPDELRSILGSNLLLREVGAGPSIRLWKRAMEGGNGLRAWRSRWSVYSAMHSGLGLCSSSGLATYVDRLIRERCPSLDVQRGVTFSDLIAANCKPLKVVSTDVRRRRPRIHSAGDIDDDVASAVRASSTYPFVFRPVRDTGDYLVDGGICSSLPVFLFDDERSRDGLPILAFDLVQERSASGEQYGLLDYCLDMVETALESGDALLREATQGVRHVPIRIPPSIGPFDLEGPETNGLYNAGYAEASRYFAKHLPQWQQAQTLVEHIQALYVPPKLVTPVLRAVSREFEEATSARATRVHVMMLTPHQTRVVVYHFGMDLHGDADLELEVDGGCSGESWMTKGIVAADLSTAPLEFQSRWRMTQSQQNKIPKDRNAMMSFPIFRPEAQDASSDIRERHLLGTLSVDSSTHLADTNWIGEGGVVAVELGKKWAGVLAKLLT